MKKSQAIKLLGGTPAIAARKLGISRQAIAQWPKVLTPRIIEKITPSLIEEARRQGIVVQLRKAAHERS